MYPRPNHMVVSQATYAPPPTPPPPVMDVLVTPGGPSGSSGVTLVLRNNGTGGTHSVITSITFTASVSNDHGVAVGPLTYFWTAGGTNTVINGQGTANVTVSRDTSDNDDTGNQPVNCTITDTNYNSYAGGVRSNGDFGFERFISA
jgi:hypothetical protein